MALKLKALIPIVLFCGVGAISLVGGVTAIYPPAGMIVAGVLLLAAGLLPDWGA